MSEYYAIIRSTDHLAHYGVKGMMWGVRKAIASGNQRALDRHFRKAAKKLAKLQDIGINSKKYAAKSAAYGAAAAGIGTLAVRGTQALKKRNDKIKENYVSEIKRVQSNANVALNPERFKKQREMLEKSGARFLNSPFVKIGDSLSEWGKGQTMILPERVRYGKLKKPVYASNDTLYRIGAGVTAAGLAAKSAQNAYRATHGEKYRIKASSFKRSMDDAFAGTKYQGQYIAPPKQRKKRRK